MIRRPQFRIVPALLAAILLAFKSLPVQAVFLPIYGGPTYDSSTGEGYRNQYAPAGSSAGSGVAVGVAEGDNGFVAVRWDASGAPATELENLGDTSNAFAINSAGTVVGVALNNSAGSRAVRWDASGTAATELGNLGTVGGYTLSYAVAINNAGTAVGSANKYVAGSLLGVRAVRWDAASTAATELGHIGTNSSGSTQSEATAINEVGMVVGWCSKWNADTDLGQRAIRWDAAGTATELGNLGTSGENTTSLAFAVNDAGTAVGQADKYVAGENVGPRAVRWDASGTAATELEDLGTDSSGLGFNYAMAVNNSGTAIGYADKFVAGEYIGPRGVRWDAASTEATELGNLGTDSTGYTTTSAAAINDAGTVVGFAVQYDGSGVYLGARAVMWGQDAVAIDLNALVDPASGWLNLSQAYDITNDNWITGLGTFDPDGPGGLDEYDRLFLMHIPNPLPGDYNNDGIVDAADYVVWRKDDGTQEGYDVWRAHFGNTAGDAPLSNTTVPEPASFVLLLFGAVNLLTRRQF